MKYTNLIEKLISIITMIQGSWFHFIFLGFLLLVVVLILRKKISKRVGFLLSCVGCFLLMGYVIFTEYATLSKIFDEVMDHFFLDLYFPSIYVYLFVFLFMNVVTLGSLLNFRKKGIYKTVNGVCFLITNFVFVLVLEILSKNQIDVFSKKSLFSNTDLVILLEFSVSIFLIWLLSLLVIYLTNQITERIVLGHISKVSIKDVLRNRTPEVNMEVALEENTSEEVALGEEDVFGKSPVPSYIESEESPKFIPTFAMEDVGVLNPQMRVEQAYLEQKQTYDMNSVFKDAKVSMARNVAPSYLETEFVGHASVNSETSAIYPSVDPEDYGMFDLSSFIPKKPESKIMTPQNSQHILEQILNNTLPVVESVDSSMEEEKNTYTLNDYRIFNKMLKDIKEHNQSNTIHIDKNLEYRLITKYSSETYDLFKRMLKIYSN